MPGQEQESNEATRKPRRPLAHGAVRPDDGCRLRRPRLADGAALWALADASETLETNSAYSYLMAADHFAETCVLAERDGRPVGMVTGFVSPARPDTVFVWQIGVAAAERGRGLASRMLHDLLDRPATARVRYLEATVTPSNEASTALFRALARDLGCPCAVVEGYPAHTFPTAHETELKVRIGPIPRHRTNGGERS